MKTPLKIHTEHFRDGNREEFQYVLPADFLDFREEVISFHSPIHLQGEVYATDEHLILQLEAHTEIEMPCSVCNEKTFVTLKTEEIYHTIPFDEMEATIFDFTDIVREEIVILIPQFIECNQGKCPTRTDIAKFMKSKAVNTQNHFPFADL